MTVRRICPPAAAPLEDYARRFDGAFASLAQRRGFREYLTGLLAPGERDKTLTRLAGANPVTGAHDAHTQRLQFFLSEARWSHELINARRLELLRTNPDTAPHRRGILALDYSSQRKRGTATAHVGHQWLDGLAQTGTGIVSVTTLWADERSYYPVHTTPCAPSRSDPSKERIGAELALGAGRAGIPFRAVVTDNGSDTLLAELRAAGLPFVVGLGTPRLAPSSSARVGRSILGGWIPVVRTFRDGHGERWWAAEVRSARDRLIGHSRRQRPAVEYDLSRLTLQAAEDRMRRLASARADEPG